MPHSLRVALVGHLVETARVTKRLSQRQVAARAKALMEANPGNYLKAAKIPNTLISSIENSVLGDDKSMQHRKTAQLLADALGVEVKTLLVEQKPVLTDENQLLVENRKHFVVANEGRGLIFEPASSILPLPALGQPVEIRPLDYTDPTVFVLLPFTPILARASFVEMCGWQGDYGDEEKIRYLFPPRPISDYMKHNSRVFEVNGDSMDPEIRNGERIVADEIPKDRWEFLVNTIVVISYADTLTVKHIKENDLMLRGTLTLHPRAGLAPLTIRDRDIHCIFEVRESFERKIYKQ